MNEDVIAVFPLPNVVFYPKTDLPLHIFEDRYRQMVEETIENKQLIGMFLLKPGWQEDYYGNPPIYSVGCAGELVNVEHLPDEKFNIVLRGLFRAQALETVQEFPYRKVRVRILPDILSENRKRIDRLKQDLIADFEKLRVPFQADTSELTDVADFAQIVHMIAGALQIDLETKMELLEENNVFVRAQILQEILRKQILIFEWIRQFGHLRSADPNRN